MLKFIFFPFRNPLLENITKIRLGLKHTIFLTFDNQIFACGDNSKGALGVDTSKLTVIKSSICQLENISNIIDKNIGNSIQKVITGWNNTFILTSK